MNAITCAIRDPRDLFPAQLFGVCAFDFMQAQEAFDTDGSMLQGGYPQEMALVADAIDKRRRQFVAGRHCAHRALAALHARSGPLLPDALGAPMWPEGMVGSISHTDGFAISAVARSARVVAIGVDVESRRERFPLSVLPQVCVDPERAHLSSLSDIERSLYATAYFSIKETIYKCVYAASGERLGFHDACVDLDLSRGVFVARLSRPCFDGDDVIDGRVGYNDGAVFSGAWCLRRTENESELSGKSSNVVAPPQDSASPAAIALAIAAVASC
jgi:4'-phosphopantetheinyl transferase EntD